MIVLIDSLEAHYIDISTLDKIQYKLSGWKISYRIILSSNNQLSGQFFWERIILNIEEVQKQIQKDIECYVETMIKDSNANN